MAAVIGIEGAVSTTVQELIDGVEASATSDFDQTAAGLTNLPLLATASLESTDLEGVLVSAGQAFSEFADPARLDQPNPEEFAVEVGCYSNADSVSYSIASSALESRTIVFTTAGNPLAEPEIDFGIGSRRTVESRVFLSGAVVFWAVEEKQNLDDMLAELHVVVTRVDTGAAVFDTTLTVSGAGKERVEPAAIGPIRFEVVGVDELAGEEGIDQESLAILQQVELEGALVIVVIPEQEHPYIYTVTADEPLVLAAQIEARVQNIPEGTGVAAVLGRPFENLADFIARGLPGVNGSAVERTLNFVTASRAIGLVEDDPVPFMPETQYGCCGAFGLELAALLGLGLFMAPGKLRLVRCR